MARKKNIIIEHQIEDLPFDNVEEDIVLNSPKKVTPQEIIKETSKDLPWYTIENTSYILEKKTDTQRINYNNEIILNTRTKPTEGVPELYAYYSGSISEVHSPLEQKIGNYFKLKQLISYDYSNPFYYELNNYPGVDIEHNGEKIVQNLRDLMENCFDRIVEQYPNLIIVSAYRSSRLNGMVGGSHQYNSHIEGYAIDFKVPEEHTSYVFNWCVKNLPEWHELMWAYPERANKSWIHISYKKGENIKQTTLASERENIHEYYEGERRGTHKEYQEGITEANQDLV